MATQERAYTVDDVWRLEAANENPLEKYYLIDGELCIKMAPNQQHSEIANLIAHYLTGFVLERRLGRVTVECGYHPPGDRRSVLFPDVAFEGLPRAAQPSRSTYVPYMPDLAIEIISLSQSWAQTRRKAQRYLRHGTALVWLIDPRAKRAEVWQNGTEQREVIQHDGELGGGDILPGFRLPLSQILP